MPSTAEPQSPDQQRVRKLRRSGLRFFGAVTAGQSHEIINVLNIINEFAGLQEDLVAAAASGRQVDLERLHDLASRVRSQVSRGEIICKAVNTFAHSVDTPVSVFDVTTLVERVAMFADRPARLNTTTLDIDLPQQSVVLEGSPFDLQQAVYLCVELAVQGADQKRQVVLSYSHDDDSVVFEIVSGDPILLSAAQHEQLGLIQLLVDEMDGQLEATPDGTAASRSFRLRLPIRSPDGP